MALKRHKLTTKRHKTIRCYTTGPHKNIQITKKKTPYWPQRDNDKDRHNI